MPINLLDVVETHYSLKYFIYYFYNIIIVLKKDTEIVLYSCNKLFIFNF